MTRTGGTDGDVEVANGCAYDPTVVGGDGSFFRAVVESAPAATVAVDGDGAVVFANAAVEGTFGYEPASLVGAPVSVLDPDGGRDGVGERVASVADDGGPDRERTGVETVGRHRDGRSVPVELSVTAREHDGGRLLLAVARHPTDRRAERGALRRERDLVDQLLRTVPTGLVVLTDDGVIERMNDRAGEILGADPDAVVGESRRTDAWELRDADGNPVPPEERVFQLARDSGGRVVEVEHQVVRSDGERAWVQVSAAPLPADAGVDRVAVAVEDITAQKERERRLEDQNEQLERLDRLNAVIREIDQALVRATTRAEIDDAVCGTLATADPYRFAWIGDVTATGDEVTPRATGGGAADRVGAVTVAASGECAGRGPVARAVRSGSVAVAQDVGADAALEPADDERTAADVRSAASVPLAYEDSLYGVLTVYADETGVFDDTERAVLAELGATIAHAINAVTTRQALVAEHVTELTFEVTDDRHFVTALSAAEDCDVSFEGATLQSDESFRYYVTVSGSTPEAAVAFAESFPAVEAARIVSVRPDGTCLLETAFETSRGFGVVADYGGVVESAHAVDGRGEVVVELPLSADVRAVVDALSAAFDGVELRAQRERERSGPAVPATRATLGRELTGKQRTALETAYYSGFFEWPRDSTGEDVADTLGVSAPTFHKHLRVAERKLLAELFDRGTRTRTH